MTLIDQHQIIAFKGIDGNCFIAHLILELGNLDDFDIMTSK
jgi:hypothetical protein